MLKKTKLTKAILFGVVLFGSVSLDYAEEYKVFLLTGQSNSLGTTAGDSFDPASENVPEDREIKLFWNNVADASTIIGDSGGEFKNLTAQQGGYYADCALHWGPEVGFGRAMYRAGVRNIAIIKVSRGGGGNGLWSKEEGGHMYRELVESVHQAVDNLVGSGHTFKIVGILYLQGESDSLEEARVSGERLEALVRNLRKDLPHAEKMHLVIGGIAAPGEIRDTVREKQFSLAASAGDIDYFETTDLRAGLYDGLHYDRPSKIIVGERYAEKFMRLFK